MSLQVQHGNEATASMRGLMPPYLVRHDFLDRETVGRLLDYTLAHEEAFAPTRVGRFDEGAADPAMRVSRGTRELGEFAPLLRSKIGALVPDLVAQLGTTPLQACRIELELVAHNDGAFFRRHIDTQPASEHGKIRVLSGVYYFHAEPKQFSGGALRLHAIGGKAGENFVDVEPVHNSLLAFPSWAPHEVMPISCPSMRFADSRFAISCWLHRK